ncbi:hypothetical protein FVJ44_17875 [Salmonella enterica subsp. enterica serovar Panama]|nr:hypothetical protein [Salmonella enterica subsp. enterica serovar Panama]HCM4742658.1 inverse autotransporter beta domain-containing protein [Salmonella enterica subsp. enterica serovar Panama]
MDGTQTLTRRLIGLNIVVQALFPLVTAFTPAMADGDAKHRFLPLSSSPVSLRTQIYTLKAGESVADVAKKYHMTTGALRQLNQFRTFVHGFDHLRQGDELDIPLTPLPEIEWHEADMVDVSSRAGSPHDTPDQKVATAAVQAANFLASGADTGQALRTGKNLMVGEAGNQLQHWLNRFGTARVQLNADERFSLKNSEFDLLAPLYDKGSNVFFTQGSLHRTDDRTQMNLGFGFRHLTSQQMLGGNLFSDYDLSRDHARAGIGVEYWRDFLKLGANSYFRLTGWRDSPDVPDYEERPANGWDIRVRAWLPALPQLGGKLTFEQYYGNEVALFGRDHRQNNPHAITAGISYTPVPLLTVSAEQRQGQSGQNDSRLGLEMNYQLGVPWRNQVNPEAVASMRSLAGSRYDLVERNNNIVLEYRKKDVIRLRLAEEVTGYAAEQKSLGVSVTSSHGLAYIDWSAPSLTAAGGKIVQSAGGYDVVLPPYQVSTGAVNTYTISGIAVDTKGNHSARSETRVRVQAPDSSVSPPAQTTSLINTDKTGYKVGENIVVSITLKDPSGNAVSGESVRLDNAVIVPNADKAGAWQEMGSGIYTRAFTARTPGTHLKATLKMTDWRETVESSEYEIAVSSIAPEGLVVNGYTFTANAGFPTTGFAGANFTFELRNGESPADYTWASDASWVTVNNDGKVVLQANGGNQKVTITGTPKNRTGDPVSYSFQLKGWYVSAAAWNHLSWSEANQRCNSLPGGYTLPSIPQLNGATTGAFGYVHRGTLGGLWSEWGNMTNYPGNYPDEDVWSSDSNIDSSGRINVYTAKLADNDASWSGGTVTQNGNEYAVCRRQL